MLALSTMQFIRQDIDTCVHARREVIRTNTLPALTGCFEGTIAPAGAAVGRVGLELDAGAAAPGLPDGTFEHADSTAAYARVGTSYPAAAAMVRIRHQVDTCPGTRRRALGTRAVPTHASLSRGTGGSATPAVGGVGRQVDASTITVVESARTRGGTEPSVTDFDSGTSHGAVSAIPRVRRHIHAGVSAGRRSRWTATHALQARDAGGALPVAHTAVLRIRRHGCAHPRATELPGTAGYAAGAAVKRVPGEIHARASAECAHCARSTVRPLVRSFDGCDRLLTAPQHSNQRGEQQSNRGRCPMGRHETILSLTRQGRALVQGLSPLRSRWSLPLPSRTSRNKTG
jgi:hypothetical protein